MTKRFLTLALALAATTIGLAQTQTARTEAPKSKIMTLVQGTWTFTSSNGGEMPAGVDVAVTITDNKYVQTAQGQVVERGTFKLDETKKPMWLDLTVTEGDSAGKSQVGLFEVTETTMKGKLSLPGETTRPTDLNPSDGFFAFTATKKK
jgi:uncharacterized protein (TIGR03067 family)